MRLTYEPSSEPQVTPLFVTEFLHRVVDVFRDYFNEVTS